MTTESVQTNYINADPKGQKKPQASNKNPSKLDLDLAIFAAYEEREGLKPSTIKLHASIVRSSLAIIAERRKVSNHRKITKADLKYLEDRLAERGYRQPGRHARVLAKFVSAITRTEPIISLSSMEKFHGECILLSAPGIEPRRTLGNNEDKRRIEERFGAQIESFLMSEVEAGLGLGTVSVRRKCVYAGIFAFEQSCGTFDPNKATLDDMDRLYRFLKDFHVQDSARTRNNLAMFISFVTGNPVMVKIRDRRPKEDWTSELKEKCPFPKEIGRYIQLLEARGVIESYARARGRMAAVVGGLLSERHQVKTVAQVELEMVNDVMEVIATHVAVNSTRAYYDAFLNFATFFGRDDLHEKGKKRTLRNVFIPQDECDEAFKAKLDEWREYLEKWEYSANSLKCRLSASVRCYAMLKNVKGPFKLESLEPYDIQTLRNAMTGFHETSIKAYLHYFSRFLVFSIGRDLFAESHLWFNGLDASRNFVQMGQFEELWNAGGPLDHMILALGGAMGLRKIEMLRMKVYDFKDGMAVIRGKGAGIDGKRVKMETPELVRRTLEEYLPYREMLLSRYGDRSSGSLLINPFEKELCMPLSISGFDHAMAKLSERSGVSFTSHGLRRMYAMNLSDAGLDLDTIRRMMRHASVDTTLKCYLHADPRKMHGALEKVNGAFSTLELNPKPADV